MKKAAENGAVYFAPKDKMIEIDLYISDVLQALDKNKSPWDKLFERLGFFYDKRFRGTNWRKQEKDFWEKKVRTKFLI